MTLEERAEAYAMAQYVSARNKNEETAPKNLYWLALKQAYLAGATEDKWVKINSEDDLPREHSMVMCTDGVGVYCAMYDNRNFHMVHVIPKSPITHWQPLPSLPPTGNKSL